jgi:hypothetical protein
LNGPSAFQAGGFVLEGGIFRQSTDIYVLPSLDSWALRSLLPDQGTATVCSISATLIEKTNTSATITAIAATSSTLGIALAPASRF